MTARTQRMLTPRNAMIEVHARLQAQGMLGFVLIRAHRFWDGRIHKALLVARRLQQRDAACHLVLVSTTGVLFHHHEGQATHRVGSDPNIPERIDVRPATRRRLRRAAVAIQGGRQFPQHVDGACASTQ